MKTTAQLIADRDYAEGRYEVLASQSLLVWGARVERHRSRQARRALNELREAQARLSLRLRAEARLSRAS